MRTSQIFNMALLLVGSLWSLSASAASYDAAKDFSLTSNPNGVWTYGSTTAVGGAPTLFSKSGTGPLEPNAGSVSYWNTGAASWDGYHAAFANLGTSAITVSAGLVLQPGVLALHPSNSNGQAVARFTAPASGSYAVSATFTALDDQAHKTDAAVAVNGASQMSKQLSGVGSSASYSQTVSLSKGQTIDFVVGNGGDGFRDDAVKLVATVTPASAIPQADITAIKAKSTLCRAGLTVLSTNMYTYPADTKVATGGKRAWADVYAADFKANHLPACNEVSAFLKKYKGDPALTGVEATLSAVSGSLDGYFSGTNGVTFLGDRMLSYCPNAHKSQFDCVAGNTRSLNYAIPGALATLDAVDKL